MAAFKLFRIFTFILLATFSVITLGISGHLQRIINISSGSEESVWNVFNDMAPVTSRLAIAVSTITLVFIGPLAFADVVAVELLWTFTLEALWLATAAYASSRPPYTNAYWPEHRALQAFAHMNWIFLFFYNFTLLALTVVAFSKGNKSVFSSRVNRTNFFHQGLPSTVDKEQKLTQSYSPQV